MCVADASTAIFGGSLSTITTGAGYFILGYYACVFEGFLVSLTGALDLDDFFKLKNRHV